MTPLQMYEAVWQRADMLTAIHAYLASNTTAALRPDEILRAEWVARVSALDLYVHELVSQRMVAIFAGALPATQQFNKFKIMVETAKRIASAPNPADAIAAFDLDVRQQLGIQSFQLPDKVADAIRLCSVIDLWGAVALHEGATEAQKIQRAKDIKKTLSLIVERRNKIAHEGDLQPQIPRVPWPIDAASLATVREFIDRTVRSIDSCVLAVDP